MRKNNRKERRLPFSVADSRHLFRLADGKLLPVLSVIFIY